MNPSSPRRGQINPALAIALGVVAVAGIAGAVLVSRPASPAGPAGPGAFDRPSAAPVATPVATPVTPTPEPTAKPSTSPSGERSIELESASGHDVVLKVHDQVGKVAAVASGEPGDGMSVRWHDALVRSAGPNTIVVTWAGLPKDDTVDLGVAIVDGKLQVTIVQAGPVPYSDAMGEDRIVAITFDGAISASDIVVEVLDRTVD